MQEFLLMGWGGGGGGGVVHPLNNTPPPPPVNRNHSQIYARVLFFLLEGVIIF